METDKLCLSAVETNFFPTEKTKMLVDLAHSRYSRFLIHVRPWNH